MWVCLDGFKSWCKQAGNRCHRTSHLLFVLDCREHFASCSSPPTSGRKTFSSNHYSSLRAPMMSLLAICLFLPLQLKWISNESMLKRNELTLDPLMEQFIRVKHLLCVSVTLISLLLCAADASGYRERLCRLVRMWPEASYNCPGRGKNLTKYVKCSVVNRSLRQNHIAAVLFGGGSSWRGRPRKTVPGETPLVTSIDQCPPSPGQRDTRALKHPPSTGVKSSQVKSILLIRTSVINHKSASRGFTICTHSFHRRSIMTRKNSTSIYRYLFLQKLNALLIVYHYFIGR